MWNSIFKIILPVIFLCLPLHVYSQTNQELYQLYQEKNYNQLKEKYEKVKANLSKAEQIFFDTIFIKDAEKAFQVYKDLFQDSNGKLKYYCGERLKDFYYAKGYYSTASDYEKYLVDNSHLIEEKSFSNANYDSEIIDEEKLFIQVGAFGLKENAKQMSDMLNTQKIKSKIKIRHVNNKDLFCVWVLGKEDFKQTLKLADELKQKYHLDYKIIKE
ncbi:MAG: SPOR domain-containing protein [Calditrichaeota bacterium]|nr:MAG: SPOR domain-containing protein [Calditrichota bacterium]MBL1204259.1 SPOR domain-containing protein [Calditrichota bacterium]